MADQAQRRAGLYMRISRDATGQALGVTRQAEDCRALAERLGWEVAETYVDNDISATSGKPRPAYRRMLADLDAGRIDAIVAWHPDRLYRRAVDLGELVEAVQRHKVPVATANAGDVDLTSPTGLLVAEMLAAIAMYEVRHKSERWTRSWRQGREAGAWPRTGSRLFGYTRDGELVEEEAAIARRMAADLLAGVPLLTIAEKLDADGVRTTRGTSWRTGTLRQYLLNPRLAGWSTLNGDIVGEGAWEPVLDRETWETVRAFLTARGRPYVPRKALLNGLIFCVCGQRMISSGARRTRTYRCPNRPGMRGCGRVSGNAEPIEEFVESYARRLLARADVRQRIAELRAEPADVHTDLAAVEQRIAELERQLDEPGVPVPVLLRALDRAKARRDGLLRDLGARETVPIPAAGEPWPTDLHDRRALVDLVVSRVVLHRATRPGASRLGFDPARVQII